MVKCFDDFDSQSTFNSWFDFQKEQGTSWFGFLKEYLMCQKAAHCCCMLLGMDPLFTIWAHHRPFPQAHIELKEHRKQNNNLNI